jgi:predicted Fe-S protein YdhL (DUF1289 family)
MEGLYKWDFLLERRVNQDVKTTVASPCINVCQMDDMTGLCRGCFRTLDEISGWSRASNDDKLVTLVAVNRRRVEHDPCGDDFRGDCAR